MTPEQQRIAIAEACGWTGFNPDNIPDCLQYTARAPSGKWGLIPDYLNDLNAMHEAENSLDHIKQCQFAEKLFRAMTGEHGVSDFMKIHASASQRAEAFLKTINKFVA